MRQQTERHRTGSLDDLKKRYYQAAVPTQQNYGWDMLAQPPDFIIRNAVRTLRARAREQYQNNEYARRFIGMLMSNVVGSTGFTLQGLIRKQNGNTDTKANQVIESAYADWSKRENFDVTGKMGRAEHERMFMRNVALDGEYLARIIRGPQGGPAGISLQVLDCELLPVWYERDLVNGSFIRMGVEFSAIGKPLAYHLLATLPNQYSYTYTGYTYTRVPASDIIHEFIPEWVSQKRGIPWMAAALMSMKMLSGYEEAALVAARVGAANMGFITSQTGDEFQGDHQNQDGSLEIDSDPGTFRELPAGMDLKAWNPKYPDNQFSPFVKGILRRIASGLGLSYNTLANDLEQVNYSSLRAGTLEDRDYWKMLQDWMCEAFCERLYREWLSIQLLRGSLKVPNHLQVPVSFHEDNEDKYRQVTFIPRRWSWVDPQKEGAAALSLINGGIKSRSEVIRESGRDPQRVFQEIADENAQMKALGIVLVQPMIEEKINE